MGVPVEKVGPNEAFCCDKCPDEEREAEDVYDDCLCHEEVA